MKSNGRKKEYDNWFSNLTKEEQEFCESSLCKSIMKHFNEYNKKVSDVSLEICRDTK